MLSKLKKTPRLSLSLLRKMTLNGTKCVVCHAPKHIGGGGLFVGGGAVDMLYVQEMKWVRSMNSFKGLGGMSDKKTSFMVSRYFA